MTIQHTLSIHTHTHNTYPHIYSPYTFSQHTLNTTHPLSNPSPLIHLLYPPFLSTNPPSPPTHPPTHPPTPTALAVVVTAAAVAAVAIYSSQGELFVSLAIHPTPGTLPPPSLSLPPPLPPYPLNPFLPPLLCRLYE